MERYVKLTSKGVLGRSAGEKCDSIIADGGKEIRQPKEWIPNLVCVVDNGFFGAAAYAYSENEMKVFQQSTDGRSKRWLVWDKVEIYAQ